MLPRKVLLLNRCHRIERLLSVPCWSLLRCSGVIKRHIMRIWDILRGHRGDTEQHMSHMPWRLILCYSVSGSCAVCCWEVLPIGIYSCDHLSCWILLCDYRAISSYAMYGWHLLGGHRCDSEQYMHTVPSRELLCYWCGEPHRVCGRDILSSGV